MKPINNLTSNLYKPNSKYEIVKPTRYLYHLTYNMNIDDECCVKRYSFIKYGIQGIEFNRRGVWANADFMPIQKMWPIPIDGFDWYDYYNGDYKKGFLEYDIWRIDTRKCKNIWYQDPVMTPNEAKCYGCDYRNYLFTENTVPSSALKLFRLEPHWNYNENRKINILSFTSVNKMIEHFNQNKSFIT